MKNKKDLKKSKFVDDNEQNLNLGIPDDKVTTVFLEQNQSISISNFLVNILETKKLEGNIELIYMKSYRNINAIPVICIYVLYDNCSDVEYSSRTKLENFFGIDFYMYNISKNNISFDDLYLSDILYDKSEKYVELKNYLCNFKNDFQDSNMEAIKFEPPLQINKVKVKGK